MMTERRFIPLLGASFLCLALLGCRGLLDGGDRAPAPIDASDASPADASREAEAGPVATLPDASADVDAGADALADASIDAPCAADACAQPPADSRFSPVVVTSDMETRSKVVTQPAPSDPLLLPAFSLRAAMTPVRDQGHRGTSATFAAVALLERALGGDLSEQCIVREIGGNSAATIASRFDLLLARGAVDEAACPYDPLNDGANVPAPYDYATLARTTGTTLPREHMLVTESSEGDDGILNAKWDVDLGYPVIATLLAPEGAGWLDPDPSVAIDIPPQLLCNGVPLVNGVTCSSQAVVIVGYDDADGSFLVRNSWGTSWKDGGYGRVKYDYFRKLAFGDLARLPRKYTPLPPPASDFDGDGASDLVVVDASGSHELLGAKSGSPRADAWVDATRVRGAVDYVPGDFDGDGRADLLAVTRDGTRLLRGKAGGGFDVGPSLFEYTLDHARFTTGDFDGDHRSDFIVATLEGSFAYLGKADGTFAATSFARPDLPLGTVSYTPGDFDGDGRTDVLIADYNGTYLYTGQADGTFRENVWVRGDLRLETLEYIPGDFDGDGCSDLIIVRPDSSWIYGGSRDGQFVPNLWHRTDLQMGYVDYVVADVDGDHKSDVMITTVNGSWLYRGIVGSLLQPNTWIQQDLPLGRVRWLPSDLNGDGRSDFVVETPARTSEYGGNADTTLTADLYTRSDWPFWGLSIY